MFLRDGGNRPLGKARRIDNGEWTYGYFVTMWTEIYVGDGTRKELTSFMFPNESESIVDPVPVGVVPGTYCEYIGMVGTLDLYAGDKVLAVGVRRVGNYETEIVRVMFGYTLKDNRTGLVDTLCLENIAKTIGNIYDDKE